VALPRFVYSERSGARRSPSRPARRVRARRKRDGRRALYTTTFPFESPADPLWPRRHPMARKGYGPETPKAVQA